MTELETLKAELRWCIAEGTYGPRTGAALQWAPEMIEALEAEKQAA